jgi:hypothetical protein
MRKWSLLMRVQEEVTNYEEFYMAGLSLQLRGTCSIVFCK